MQGRSSPSAAWEREHSSNNAHTIRCFQRKSRACTPFPEIPGAVCLESLQTPAKISTFRGRLAQLGERIVRNDEVGGSNPPPSTKNPMKTMFSESVAISAALCLI